jgi:hypothetical protein
MAQFVGDIPSGTPKLHIGGKQGIRGQGAAGLRARETF